MHVISRKRLRDFEAEHQDARPGLDSWFRLVSRGSWQSIVELKAVFPTADAVGDCIVFNVGGNKYRLIVKIRFDRQVVYVTNILSHKEYSKGKWKEAC